MGEVDGGFTVDWSFAATGGIWRMNYEHEQENWQSTTTSLAMILI